VIENGRFYYDFYARSSRSPQEDLPVIEKKMREIIAQQALHQGSLEPRQGQAGVRDKGEAYKVELIEAIPEDQDSRSIKQGDWFDLCRGPHMASTGQIGTAFKLMKVAGAYWRGDSATTDADPHLRHGVGRARQN
jgi:threonyl-tRNA synthetase